MRNQLVLVILVATFLGAASRRIHAQVYSPPQRAKFARGNGAYQHIYVRYRYSGLAIVHFRLASLRPEKSIGNAAPEDYTNLGGERNATRVPQRHTKRERRAAPMKFPFPSRRT